MTCPNRVGKGIVTYPCTLPAGHSGPDSSTENQASQRERQRWETEQAEQVRYAASGLGQFQGKAETTAQRYSENATPVPLSAGRRNLHSHCHPWECDVYDGEPPNRRSAQDECPVFTGAPAPTEVPEAFLLGVQVGEFSEQYAAREDKIAAAEPTKQRAGDQVLPTKNDFPDIQSQVIADIEKRRQVGISRYGIALQPHNGRDMLLDAYEEAMDLCIYLKGVMVERDSPR